MLYQFVGYQFDSKHRLLTHNDNVIPLNDKTAQLLLLFLQHPQRVFSKAELLENIWPDRVVTEQVIFQNISKVRALFGDDAIKTFSKKGYQWQFPVTVTDSSGRGGQNWFRRFLFPCVAVPVMLSFVGAMALGVFMLMKANTVTPQGVHFITQSAPGTEAAEFSVQAVFDSADHYWLTGSSSSSDILVAWQWHELPHSGVLRFMLAGTRQQWEGVIEASRLSEAVNELDALTMLIAKHQYIQARTMRERLASLTLIASEYNKSGVVQRQEIALLLQQQNFERAALLLEQQSDKNVSEVMAAILAMYKLELAMRTDQWSEAKSASEFAIEQFGKTGIGFLHANALLESAWFYFVNNQIRQGMQILNQASRVARENEEPVLEVRAHLIQAFIASKAGETELMHTQLGLAAQLLDFYQLPAQHQVAVLYYRAWADDSSADSLAIYQQLLTLPFSEKYGYMFYAASDWLFKEYVQERSLEKALSLIMPWQRPSYKSALNAGIARERGDLEAASAFASDAFGQAVSEGEIIQALDAALLAIQIARQKGQSVPERFADYIARHSTRRWQAINSRALAQIQAGS